MRDPMYIIFVEGKTEKIILEKLNEIWGAKKGQIKSCGGITEIKNKIIESLEVYFSKKPQRILVIRDIETGETRENIIRKFRDIVEELIAKTQMHTHCSCVEIERNIIVYDVKEADFKLVLHLADAPTFDGIPEFKNKTIDEYILALAFEDRVIERFANEINIDATTLKNKILIEIPNLLMKNGIKIDEAKDYIGIYVAASRFIKCKRTIDNATFAKIVLYRSSAHARSHLETTFSTLKKALIVAGVIN